MRRVVRACSVVSFVLAVLLMVAQVLLWSSDVIIFLMGDRPFLFILAGAGSDSVLNIALTLWLYCSFTAYAAFWFCAGMGLRALAAPRASV